MGDKDPSSAGPDSSGRRRPPRTGKTEARRHAAFCRGVVELEEATRAAEQEAATRAASHSDASTSAAGGQAPPTVSAAEAMPDAPRTVETGPAGGRRPAAIMAQPWTRDWGEKAQAEAARLAEEDRLTKRRSA